MLTLIEIEKAVAGLSTVEKLALQRYLEREIEPASTIGGPPGRHSVLDIPAIRIGPVLQTFDAGDDLLDEMLEG